MLYPESIHYHWLPVDHYGRRNVNKRLQPSTPTVMTKSINCTLFLPGCAVCTSSQDPFRVSSLIFLSGTSSKDYRYEQTHAIFKTLVSGVLRFKSHLVSKFILFSFVKTEPVLSNKLYIVSILGLKAPMLLSIVSIISVLLYGLDDVNLFT